MGQPKLTFQQLFEYLENGANDPAVEAMLELPGNSERLVRAKRLYDLVKAGGLPDEDSPVMGFAEPASEHSIEGLSEPLEADFLDVDQSRPAGKSGYGILGQSMDGLQQAARTMRNGGTRLRVSGILRMVSSGTLPGLEFVPRPRPPLPRKLSRKSVGSEDATSFESVPGASLDSDLSDIGFERTDSFIVEGRMDAAPDLSSSADAVEFRLSPLIVVCRVELANRQPLLTFEVKDTRWRAPAKQLEILYVPKQGLICRVTTDLKGRASLPLPAGPGRLRFDCDPAAAVDIELEE
ncbi:hypothetical protein ACFL1S_03195 [Pseudomonadota bacterium]